MKSICVFCGSKGGDDPIFAEAARAVGETLARRSLRLVYGAGDIGMMGVLADAALAAGGEVVGVIPQALVDREVCHAGLTELYVVDSMHQRKAKMVELADAFLCLPGGFGTFEEFCEVLTWAQLGLIRKPCGLLNTAGYYDPLIEMFDRAVERKFLRPQHRELVLSGETIDELLAGFERYQPPELEQWIEESET